MDSSGRHVETYLKSQRNGAPVAYSRDLSDTPSIGFSPSLSLWLVGSLPNEGRSQALPPENLRLSLVEALGLWAPVDSQGLAPTVSSAPNPGPGPPCYLPLPALKGFVDINRVHQAQGEGEEQCPRVSQGRTGHFLLESLFLIRRGRQ